MATLQKKGNGWYCQFLHHGKRHTITIGRVSKAEAHAKSDQIEYLLMRLKRGLIELPPGVDIREFVRRDGKPGTGEAVPLRFESGTEPSGAATRVVPEAPELDHPFSTGRRSRPCYGRGFGREYSYPRGVH